MKQCPGREIPLELPSLELLLFTSGGLLEGDRDKQGGVGGEEMDRRISVNSREMGKTCPKYRNSQTLIQRNKFA